MAYLKLDQQKLKHNFNFLEGLFSKNNISWGVVSKLLCGTESYLNELVELGIKEIHDSRISNLQKIKELDPTVQTVYIKPPARRSIKEIVKYADVSFNTELETMKLLSEEAARQNKKHKVIIMIEMGDLREGVMGEDLLDFYESVFRLPNIFIVGLGTNLNCLHGIMPSEDKLVQLSLYKQIIELKFKREIPWVSGGTSVVLPLLLQNRLPKGINHFRIGEALFFGLDLFTGQTIPGMEDGLFTLHAEIIEISQKPAVPFGETGTNPSGEETEIDPNLYGKEQLRAIIDVGLLDIQPKFLRPVDKSIETIGASSDMLILNITHSENSYKVGDTIAFDLDYMGALTLMNSFYVEKRIKKGTRIKKLHRDDKTEAPSKSLATK